MTCPRCGHSQADAPECVRCGVVVAKVHPRAALADLPHATSAATAPAAKVPVANALDSNGPAATAQGSAATAQGPAATAQGSAATAQGLGGARRFLAALRAEQPPALRDRLVFFQQLGRLTGAGVAIPDTLGDLAAILAGSRLGLVLETMRAEVSDGASLAATMAARSWAFDELEVALVATCRDGPRLPAVAANLAERLERQDELRAALRTSLRYPLLVALTACVTLPLPSLLADSVAAFALAVAGNLLLLGVFLVIFAWFLPKALRRPGVRGPLLAALASLPFAGDIVRNRRFMMVFDGLHRSLDAGLPVAAALTVATRLPGEVALARFGQQAARALTANPPTRLGAELGALPGLDRRSCALLATAERSGTLALTLGEETRSRRAAYRRQLATTSAFLRGGVALVLAVVVAMSLIARFRDGLADPLAMLPAADREDLRRELERAMPQLPNP